MMMSSQISSVEGHWAIVDYPQHPECIGYQFSISRDTQKQNLYHLHTRIVNILNCQIEYNPITNEWKPLGVMSTRMLGPPDMMNKERVVSNLISGIQYMKVRHGQLLNIKTSRGEQVRLTRVQYTVPTV